MSWLEDRKLRIMKQDAKKVKLLAGKLKEQLKKKEDLNKAREQLRTSKREAVKFRNLIGRQNYFDIRGRINFWKHKLYPERTYLINMELRNGHHSHFIICPIKEQFTFLGATYIIDTTMKYYDVNSKIYCFDYHQDLSMPVKREIDVMKLRDKIALPGITEVDSAINPYSLKYFIESEVIQKVMKGEELDKLFRFMRLMLIIIAIVAVITMLIVMQMSGILKQFKIW